MPKPDLPLNIDLVNYFYLISIPELSRSSVDKKAIKLYEDKYPELKDKTWLK